MNEIIFIPNAKESIGLIRKRLKPGYGSLKTIQKPKNQSRCVHWKSEALYTCLRRGRDFATQSEFLTTAANGTLQESDLFIFRHLDVRVDRNSIFPKYEGVFKCGSQFIKAQKAHLAQAYSNSNRTNKESVWQILQDGTPYWVDRYAVGKGKK